MDEATEVFQMVKQQALTALDVHKTKFEHYSDAEVRLYLAKIIQQVAEQLPQYQVLADPNLFIEQVLDDLLGLGPLEPLLRNKDVTEIMVNRYDSVFIERQGQLEPAQISFQDELSVRRVIERIVTPLGRRIDESSPMVDARLQCGSRMNAVIPPLAIDGSALTIRKFMRTRWSLADLVQQGSCTEAMATVLAYAVKEKSNMIISGGTGSGKTTLLNILADAIPVQERLITIEDAAELALPQENIVRLEARPANQEGEGAVSIRQLLVNALRMRPDRIIIGECRGQESLDMLQAMNTGHQGSMTSLHANTPRDAIRRLETMVLMAGQELPLLAIRQQIASAIQLIVQVRRDVTGQRRISSITEVQGLEGEVMRLSEIFSWNSKQKRYLASGEIPQLMSRAEGKEKAALLACFLTTTVNSFAPENMESES